MAIDLNDKTSNNNTLTNVDATEVTTLLPFVASTIAVDFSAASTQYMEANDSASLSLSTTGTLEFWVKFTSIPTSNGAMDFIAKDDQDAQRSYYFAIQDVSGVKRLTATVINGVSSDYYYFNWTPSVDIWYHLALTIDTGNTSATTFEFFIDGISQGNGTAITSDNISTIADSTIKLTLGCTYTSVSTQGNFLDGKMDDIRIWNDVRTVTEINNNKSVELTGEEAGLVAYWPFEADIITSTSTTSSSTSTTSTSSSTTSTSTSTTSTSTSTSTTSTSTSTTSTSSSTSTSTSSSSSTSTTMTSSSTTMPFSFQVDHGDN